ncbi:hypothetical protein QT971_11665 [Microcoleus sp. herbarium19]|uniref:hypothetical protein n=1 Tax=unclassified Microcoleus TaxID=2642155 RepID=UPI002FD08745
MEPILNKLQQVLLLDNRIWTRRYQSLGFGRLCIDRAIDRSLHEHFYYLKR